MRGRRLVAGLLIRFYRDFALEHFAGFLHVIFDDDRLIDALFRRSDFRHSVERTHAGKGNEDAEDGADVAGAALSAFAGPDAPGDAEGPDPIRQMIDGA